MNENNNMENLPDTIPEEVPSAEQPIETPTEGAPQPNDEQNGQESSEEKQPTENEAFLPISFNHEDITLSREEAVKYAQLGKLYSESGLDIGTVKPIYNKLDYLAAQKDTTVEALVENMLTSDEAQYRAELEAKFGVDDTETIAGLLEIRRNNQKQKYNKVVEDRKAFAARETEAQRQNLNSRLASEFIELQAEFPEFAKFEDVPKAVKDEAAKGRDLLSCYLRYKNSEEKRIAAANDAAKEAENASTGSSSSKADEGISESEKMFRNGLWGI